MKILVFAEGYSWGMGPALLEALQQLGHEAELFDWTKFKYSSQYPVLIGKVLDRVFLRRVASDVNTELQRYLNGRHYNLVIVAKGLLLTPETVRELHRHSDVLVNWNPDDFFNPVNSSVNLVKSFEIYDCIYTARKHLLDEYHRRGAKRCVLIDWYYVPKYYFPLAAGTPQAYHQDISFIGSWSRRREALISSLGMYNVRVYGASWKWASLAFRRKVRCMPPVFGADMRGVIQTSKINLNILTVENRDTTNLRNFEVAACGGFQLSERSPEILSLFKEGEEIACFSDAGELATRCAYYLSADAERNAIAVAGCRRVMSGGHSITDRARTIVETAKRYG